MTDDVRKGLGIKRRKPKDEDDGPSSSDGEQADDEPKRREPSSSSSSGPRLGIKRRSGPQAAVADAPAKADADADEDAGEAAEKKKGKDAPASTGPRYGDDLTAVLLRNHFKLRPGLLDHIPPRAFELKRTHGRYSGDGREERIMVVGFRPALIVWVLPPYGIETMPKFTAKGIVEPGLERQPRFLDKGFIIDAPFNKPGDMYIYVAFADDGEPLELEKKRGRGSTGRGGSGSSSGSSSGPKLGIKRRK